MTSPAPGAVGARPADGAGELVGRPPDAIRSRRVQLGKTVTWRLVATATTVLIAFLVTGDLTVGATIGGVEAAAKMVLYYGHERAWTRITS